MPHLPQIGLIILLGVTACTVLPSVKSTTRSPWSDFSEAQTSYEKITPGRTTIADLEEMGFDPLHTPNVRRVNYVEILQYFLPNDSLGISDLNPELRRCLDLDEECYAYEVTPGQTFSKRHGNAVLDVLGIRRRTTTKGWKFTALVVIRREVVVYKIWGGEPKIRREEDSKKPLGPLQEMGSVLQRVY
jgi:hypothetical protein